MCKIKAIIKLVKIFRLQKLTQMNSRRSNKVKHRQSILREDSDQQFELKQVQSDHSQQEQMHRYVQNSYNGRARRSKTNKNLNQDDIYKKIYENKLYKQKEQQMQIQQQVKQQEPKFLTPKVQCLLAKRIRQTHSINNISNKSGKNNQIQKKLKKHKMSLESQSQSIVYQPDQHNTQQEYQDQEEFLVKFQRRSYLRVRWMTKDQILTETGTQVTSNMLKSMALKIKKLGALKLHSDSKFNPNFLLADRLMSSTQIFTAIHHKKANQIKGKWDQSMMLVCSKLLNFIKDGYPYGVHFHEPYVQQIEDKYKIHNQTNMGQIINRIYLSQFRNSKDFWLQLGRAIRIYLQIFNKPSTDNFRVGLGIKEASIFLYEQWHILCKERYRIVRNQLITNGTIQGNKIQAIQAQINQESPTTPQIDEQYQHLDMQKLCKTNIFLTQKIVQTPKNQTQLELLNPGQFSFNWLQQKQSALVDLDRESHKYVNLDGTIDKKVQKQCDKYLNYQYQQLNVDDMKNLNLNVEVDRLYLVKWKDLSYGQSTWQCQSLISKNEKIIQFKNWNKIPNRETRQKVQIHNKIHKFLLQYYQTPQNRITKNPNISKMQKKLYLLNDTKQSKQSKPREYGGKDIPIFKNYRMLKDFQLESLNWMIKNWYENRNCILADQMGLGKTIQTISFLYHLHTYQGVLGPFLVLAPLTTLQQWRRQIQQWTEFNCLLYYDEGSHAARQIIQNYQFFHLHTTKNGDIIPSKIPKFQILLVNYELFVNDFEILKKIPFQHMVLDQAHRLKNKRSNTTKMLSMLPCCRKTLLTGTPIQNNTTQLFTLLNFIQPFNFPSQQSFISQFGLLHSQQSVKQFKKLLKPYLLRRIKEDVEKTIPKLYQMIIDVEMTKKQKEVYRGLLEKNKNDMIKGLSTANFNSLAIQLRKCCNHPFLISNDLQNQLVRSFGTQHQAFYKSSGKMILMMKLLKKFKAEGKKVLVFSQFVIMLDLMKVFLEIEGYNVEILKGSLNQTTRHQAITRFNEDISTDLFLISTKAGGVGINLITASEIIIYDSDWNPQNDIQATARAHRIGQKKEVTVYRLITSNTYEAEMFQISSKKLGLDKAVFTGECFKTSGEFNDAEKQMSKQQIQTLLKKGILGFLENQGNQEQYFNQTIQDILQKNARKIQYLSNPTSTAYSKTKFVSEQGHNDISLDAPDFWQRALKNVQTPLDKLCKKGENLKEYFLPQKQQQLMIQAYSQIYEFVRNKTVGTGFNHQNERQLNKFLQQVSGQRKFLRKYRDIANTFLEQIQKPSRRFRVKYDDLLLNKKTNNSDQSQQKQQNGKKRRIVRSRRTKITQAQEQASMQLQEQNYNQEKQVYSGVSSGQKVSNEINEQESVSNGSQMGKCLQYLQRLCHSCKKPKCTMFCSGICGRSYHKKCYQKILINDDDQSIIQHYDQLEMNFQIWRNQLQFQEKCPTCLSDASYYLMCAQCGVNGTYKTDDKKKKKKNQDKDQIPTQIYDDHQLFKCSVAKCHSFYHLKCLFNKEYQNKFASSLGKPIVDISNVIKTFRCPSHYCRSCYGTDQSSVITNKPSKCLKCPISYHERKCMPKNFIKVMKGVYICSSHLTTQKMDEATIKKEYQPFKLFIQSAGMKALYVKENKKKKRGVKQSDDLKLINKKSQKMVEQSGQKQLMSLQKDSKQQKIAKKKPKGPLKMKYSYLDIGLTPVLTFDYSNYTQDWCRYCGSRYAKTFKDSQWGLKTLCGHHFDLWKAKRINIPNVKNPKEPIHRDKETEIKYLNQYMTQNHKVKPQNLLKILEQETA